MSLWDPTTWSGRDFDPTVSPYAAAALGPMGAAVYSGAKLLPKGPKVGDIGALPVIPDLTDATVIMAQLARKQRLAALQGRASTFLTGPRGLGGPPSEIAQAFLRASLEAPAPYPSTQGGVDTTTTEPPADMPVPRRLPGARENTALTRLYGVAG